VLSQVRAAIEIAKKQAISTMLIHPLKYRGEYPAGYYEQLNSLAWGGPCIRLAIENMDKNKPDGFLLPELEHLVKSYAKDLFGAVKNSLTHLHVSGEAVGSNHCLLHRARNSAKIVEFLGWIFSILKIPIILEGEYENTDDLKAEIEFITREAGLQ
jgi:hypothetical protein